MLEAVESDPGHVPHINIFLKHMSDFEAMNAAYVEIMGDLRPARSVISVVDLPKPGVLLTMNLTAVTSEGYDAIRIGSRNVGQNKRRSVGSAFRILER